MQLTFKVKIYLATINLLETVEVEIHQHSFDNEERIDRILPLKAKLT